LEFLEPQISENSYSTYVGALEGKRDVGRSPILRKNLYFWKERPNFGARATTGKKEACKKRRKSSMQEENPRARRLTSLTILGLGILTKVVIAISL
jgi:hypothetical protein